MAIEVFNRYENKYLVNDETYLKITNRLKEYMNPDKFNEGGNPYVISNIYYDTDDNHFIRTSLQKPKYKEKLRLRAYGVPSRESKVFVEIKKKVFSLVNKRRTSMKLDEAYDFLKTGDTQHKEYMNAQVTNEIKYMLSKNELKPRLYLSYERVAFFGKDNSDLRISFDKNITTRRHDLCLEKGVYGEKLIPPGKWIMEIKVAKSMPLWLTDLLSEFSINPISFSKYGTLYKKELALAM